MNATKSVLNEKDRASPTWKRIKEHLNERLQGHRVKNDQNLSADETARYRGRIAELKYLLDLDNQAQLNQVDAE